MATVSRSHRHCGCSQSAPVREGIGSASSFQEIDTALRRWKSKLANLGIYELLIHIIVFANLKLALLVPLVDFGSRLGPNITVSSLRVCVPHISDSGFFGLWKLEELLALSQIVSVSPFSVYGANLKKFRYLFIGFLDT